MSIDLTEIEKLARATTAGPWKADDNHKTGWRVLAQDDRATIICDEIGAPSNPVAQADAELIAHMNPARALELVKYVRKLEVVANIVRHLNCCDGDDARQADAMKDALDALDSDEPKDGEA